MTDLLAIDPGNEQSAIVVFVEGVIVESAIEPNAEMRERLLEVAQRCHDAGIEQPTLAIEMIASYGMAVGRTVFDTCVWIGRFVEAWSPGPHALVYRREVKLRLCGSARAKDPNVRQAVIDLYGGTREAAIGTKRAPGPLYGIKRDLWAALAVALTVEARSGRGPASTCGPIQEVNDE